MAAGLNERKARVIGIGGVFFKSGDQDRLRSWYEDNLGLECKPEGAQFKWRSYEKPEMEHRTVWGVFHNASTYFDPSNASFMIDYIVDDLDAVLAKLSRNGVRIDPRREEYDYGRFAWIYDPDGNKIELWEPPAKYS